MNTYLKVEPKVKIGYNGLYYKNSSVHIPMLTYGISHIKLQT